MEKYYLLQIFFDKMSHSFFNPYWYCSVTKLCLILGDPMDWSLIRLPCPSLSPGVCSNLWPLSQWCHLIITSSLALFSVCPQSFLASESFPKSSVFPQRVSSLHPVDQSIRASASASVLPMNIQGWFSLGLTRLISLKSKGLSRVFSSTIVRKHQFLGIQLSLCFKSHIRTWLLENYSFNCMDLCWQSDFSAF